jgi:uncharacterized protein YjbI with pentapeptide repeats
MLAFRRQHHQEISTALTDYDAAQRRITELYSKSVEQLGSDKAPVRLGGLYALERLAQDNPDQRQTMIDVICAYLRMPFPAQTRTHTTMAANGDDTAGPSRPSQANTYMGDDEWEQEKQVRLTAQRVLADHLRRPEKGQGLADGSSERFWDDARLDLTGATFIDFDFTDGTVNNANFDGATFSGHATFDGATFRCGARFTGTTFSGHVGFNGATFSGDAWFSEVRFDGDAGFNKVKFDGDAGFEGATFRGDAWFSGTIFSSDAWFRRTIFSGDARFTGTTFRVIAEFSGAAFNSNAEFGGATFSETAWFSNAIFQRGAGFAEATFNRAGFGDANFSRGASFGGATFSGSARFDGTAFERGPDSINLAGVIIGSPGNHHVWPKGWQLQDDGAGGLTFVRAAALSADE